MAARKRRLTILPKADKLWLLAGTAIITGAVLWPMHPALADCSQGTNFLSCEDVPPNGPQLTPVDFLATGDGFEVDVGDSNTIGTIDVSTDLDEALEVSSDGGPFSGTVTITEGSAVLNEIGTALYVHDVNNVTIANDGTVTGGSFDAPAPFESGLLADSFNAITVNNNGHIGGDVIGAGFEDGDTVTFTNTSADTVFGGIIGMGYDLLGSVDIYNSGAIIGFESVGAGVVDMRGDILLDEPTAADLVDDDLLADPDEDNNLSFLVVNSGLSVDEEVGHQGGMILGGQDGIYGEDFWAGDILIYNGGHYVFDEGEAGVEDDEYVLLDGGLIFGGEDDGVDLNGMEGNVFIYNNNTLDSIALSAVGEDGPPSEELIAFASEYFDFPFAPRAGIWGEDAGITVDGNDRDDDLYTGELGGPEDDVTDAFGEDAQFVGIANINGLVLGEQGDGIRVYNIRNDELEDPIDPTETGLAFGLVNGGGGLVWGGDDGVNVFEVEGDVFIDNSGISTSVIPTGDYEALFGAPNAEDGVGYDFAGGTIFGEDNGIEIEEVDNGNVTLLNAQGDVQAWDGDGIYIEDVDGFLTGESGYLGGNVAILNGDELGGNGGGIVGDEQAIDIRGVNTAHILNGEGGWIFGDGFFGPVIGVSASSESGLLFDADDTDEDGDAIADDIAAIQIDNLGVMSSYSLPTFFWDDLGEDGLVPEWGNDDAVLASDLDRFSSYVLNGGDVAEALYSFGEDRYALPEYGAAAASWLVGAEDGALDLYNDGFMAGGIYANGFNAASGEDIGNTIVNEGTWFVTGFEGPVAVDIDGEDFVEDRIINEGWIQTAFEDSFRIEGVPVGNFEEFTVFTVDEFQNFGSTGLISMVDGGTGDVVVIDGDFFGPGFEDYQAGDRSLVAQDVDLQDAYDYFLASGENDFGSDFFGVSEDAFGTTGLIFRRVNEETAEGILTTNDPEVNDPPFELALFGEAYTGAVIPVAGVEDDDEAACGAAFCAVGNTFYIAPQSDGYFESNEGTGFIEDGLFAWGLVSDDEGGLSIPPEIQEVLNDVLPVDGTTYYLVGMVGPGAVNAPKVATGALEIADETFDIVYDHSYGYQFGGAGGGGADLPVEAPVYEEAPAASGTQTGLWAKVTGSKSERDDEFSMGGNTFDSGYDQNIYTILGGADMKWDPNSPIRMGLFGGYVNSTMDLDFGSNEVDYEGGVVGTYLAYNDGAFYADATVKGEFLSADYSFGGTDVDSDIVNLGVSANTGYRFSMGGAYIEPLASLRYVHSDVDDFEGGGGSVEYSNADSLKGGLGARIGTVFATGGATTELSLLGRVWNEFEDENEVTVSDGVNEFTYSDDISGTYGEVAGTVIVTSGDGTLSGFLTASGQFGDDYTKYGAQAGIRKGF